MEPTSRSPPGNISFSSILCPTAVTLYFLPSTYTLLFLIALPGNALSLWVFLCCISTVSPVHVYLSHLSVSNLMSSLTMPFLAMYYARGVLWPLSGVLCQVVLCFITPQLHINIYISLLILTLVALTRFATLTQHTHAPTLSTCATLLPRRFFTCFTRTAFASRVCAIVWAVVVGGIVPVTFYYSVKEASTGEDGDAEEGGGAGVCYSPPVELGGKLSTSFAITLMIVFFMFYLLVLLCYMTVLRHIRRSRRSTNVPNSHILLGRVLRNIVIIQVVLSVCLLPYHLFKPIFISLVHDQPELTFSPEHDTCHPLSAVIELKSFLLLLAALRGATDPLMYFMLDKTFRHEILRLLRCNKADREVRLAVTGSVSQSAGHVVTRTVDLH